MSYQVITLPQAEKDIREAVRWMGQHAPKKATQWGFDVIEAIRRLSKSPARCAYAPERETFGLEIRHLILGKYRILFIIEDETVYVLRVRHARQDVLRPDEDEDEE
ncbi:MAG TPA: type II toxin-antitoxin system RelE/ParE family toxin [Blastocatellia bacterium]|nr:type II toxin-antitoxin system RelE/ParE family toxin [Blastocatellia bacterium]